MLEREEKLSWAENSWECHTPQWPAFLSASPPPQAFWEASKTVTSHPACKDHRQGRKERVTITTQ
jgi:hypothetical protein